MQIFCLELVQFSGAEPTLSHTGRTLKYVNSPSFLEWDEKTNYILVSLHYGITLANFTVTTRLLEAVHSLWAQLLSAKYLLNATRQTVICAFMLLKVQYVKF